MVILRPTRKPHSLLRLSENAPTMSDTALGDWYVNRVVVNRQPLLLLVSSASLLPMIVPASDVRSLPARLASLVKIRLRRLGLASRSSTVRSGKWGRWSSAKPSTNRFPESMVDFAQGIPYYLEAERWDETTLATVEQRLAETPCHAAHRPDRVIFPETKAPELLRARWLGSTPLHPPGFRSGVEHDRGQV